MAKKKFDDQSLHDLSTNTKNILSDLTQHLKKSPSKHQLKFTNLIDALQALQNANVESDKEKPKKPLNTLPADASFAEKDDFITLGHHSEALQRAKQRDARWQMLNDSVMLTQSLMAENHTNEVKLNNEIKLLTDSVKITTQLVKEPISENIKADLKTLDQKIEKLLDTLNRDPNKAGSEAHENKVKRWRNIGIGLSLLLGLGILACLVAAAATVNYPLMIQCAVMLICIDTPPIQKVSSFLWFKLFTKTEPGHEIERAEKQESIINSASFFVRLKEEKVADVAPVMTKSYG